MNFLTYIKNNEEDLELTLQEIEEIKELLSELGDEELDELGSVLYDLFFDEEDDFEESEEDFDLEDILDMAKTLGQSGYEIIKDLMQEDPDYDDLEDDGYAEQTAEFNQKYFKDEITNIEFEEEELDEAGIQRRMQAKNMNKKKRKFMAIRKSQFKRTAPKRKRIARQNRQKNKRYRRANKHKIKQYQKSRSLAIARGRHKVKIRRQ